MSKQEYIRPYVEEILEENPLISIHTLTDELKQKGMDISHMTVHRVATSLRDAGNLTRSNMNALQVEEGGLYLLRRIQRAMSKYLDKNEEPEDLGPLIEMSTHIMMVIAGLNKRTPADRRPQIKLPPLSVDDMRKIVAGDMTPLQSVSKKTGGVSAGVQ